MGPATVGFVVAVLAGWALGGPAAGVSAGIGIAIVLANFAAHGTSLAWASTISVAAVQAVALGGFVVRLGAIIGVLFALNTLGWFSPLAFGLAVVPATLLLLAYEARLAIGGLGADLQIPADRAAIRAGEALAAREAR
jgi:ATP synthase protein I